MTNCRAPSYRKPVRRYFQHDPCRADTRDLYTTHLHGRVVVLEVEALATGLLPHDQNGAPSSGELVRLQNENSAGGVNNLLRERWNIQHTRRIPRHEVFTVSAEDSGVDVFDARYEHGRTADNDHSLKTMESQLYLTRATEVDE